MACRVPCVVRAPGRVYREGARVCNAPANPGGRPLPGFHSGEVANTSKATRWQVRDRAGALVPRRARRIRPRAILVPRRCPTGSGRTFPRPPGRPRRFPPGSSGSGRPRNARPPGNMFAVADVQADRAGHGRGYEYALGVAQKDVGEVWFLCLDAWPFKKRSYGDTRYPSESDDPVFPGGIIGRAMSLRC